LIEEKTDRLIQQLKQGLIDAALLALPIIEDSLQSQQLFTDEFKLAVAPDNPLAKNKTIKQSDLHNKQLLLLDEGHCLRGQALQVCQLNGAEEQQDVRATGLETLRQMVKAGTGITFITEIAIHEPDPDICYLPFSDPAPSRSIGLVWRKTSARTQLIGHICDLIKTTANV
jgi:LysR family hydrogen peroxide-inducible transcriptional activator